MFQAKTEKIQQLAQKYPHRIKELEEIFSRKTNVYIDYANVKPWASKLGWHVELKRLKQLLNSFGTINAVKIYCGTLVGNKESVEFSEELKRLGYIVTTKPVKIMKKSIDVSSITSASPDILKDFIRRSLLQKLKVETVEYLNSRLKELNDQGIFYIEDLKCNFDVEIGRDMLIDYDKNGIENFVLWSGDSDFASSLEQLLADGKRVFIFATARKVANELNELRKKGLAIFDIQKVRNFICWNKEKTV
ncbi:MAG: NYN domain-containing protein [Candidatus Magasanikbacteria bacterium]|nr:NYN domain-containing protein [Candidatus Magasanikbacteria bacterium]